MIIVLGLKKGEKEKTMEWIVEAKTLGELVDGLFTGGKRLVRCKDCKYKQGSSCEYSAVWARPNGFCNWGERKDDRAREDNARLDWY